MMATNLPSGEVVDHHIPILCSPRQEVAFGSEIQAHGSIILRQIGLFLTGLCVPLPNGTSRHQRAVRGEGYGGDPREGKSFRASCNVPHLDDIVPARRGDRSTVG